MSNEKIQAGLDKYNASVEKATAKFPERAHIPEQRLYTPLDIKDTDYADEIGFPGMYAANHVSWSFLDHAYVRRLLYCS